MSGNLERVLRLMAEKRASDVYLSANTPILLKINGQYVETHYQSNSNANAFGAGVTLIGTYERGNAAPATISFQVEAVREGAAGPVVVRASPQGPGMVKIKSRIV